MNLLQMLCNEESVRILQHITPDLDSETKKTLAEHRDCHLGSQAIHLASATGNHIVIETLITNYSADITAVNALNQTVYHCASQRYEGIATIFIFGGQPIVGARDSKGGTALHFAAIALLIKNVQALI